MLCTPMYGGQANGQFTRSVMDLTALVTQYGIPMRTYFLFNESLITRARNYCVDEFLRSDCTHLLFIDSDIYFDAKSVLEMLAIQLLDPENKDVVAGPYPKKNITWEKIKLAVDKGFADENPERLEDFVGDFVFNPAHGNSIKLTEPAEVSEAGTGFMLIPRSTFEKLDPLFQEYKYKPDHARSQHFDGSREIMAYFDCIIDKDRKPGELEGILADLEAGKLPLTQLQKRVKDMKSREKKASKRYLSEDYFFCQNVRRVGGKVWLLPWIELKHVGHYTFGGKLAALAAIGASATVDTTKLKKNKDTK